MTVIHIVFERKEQKLEMISAFLNSITPGLIITAEFAIFIVVVMFILGAHTSKKARIIALIALIIFLGVTVFESRYDWNGNQFRQNIYARATSGTLALYDPMNGNNNINWVSGSGCKFTGGAYHASTSQQTNLRVCLDEATNFRNFAYQVRVTIIHGDDGCLIFRIDKPSTAKEKSYGFCIGSDGSYEILVEKPNGGESVLQQGFSTAIRTGLNQMNSLTVVAQGAELDMYVNTQFIVTVSDTTSNSGLIGLGVIDYTNSTEVVFSNVLVWTL